MTQFAWDCIADFAGLRAVADTEDFVIGPTSQPSFINVAGIQLILGGRAPQTQSSPERWTEGMPLPTR